MRDAMLLILGVALAAGCGDDGASQSDFELYCASYCGWKQRCGDGSVDCASECSAQGAGLYTKARAAAVQAMTSCFRGSQDCGSDDTCYAEGVRAVAPDPLADAHFKQCMTTRDGCPESPFSDDVCGSVVILTDAGQAEVEACYEKSCAEMGACVSAVFGWSSDDEL